MLTFILDIKIIRELKNYEMNFIFFILRIINKY
jgi:hypothetical protein